MTDAELLEEERKKKEAAAMGEVQPQAPITFRDYNVPESPRGSGLSVFTRSGEVKPGVDVSAITSAPETLPEPSEVNTALNQEVQVDSVNKPGLVDFFFGAPTPKQAQKILETQPTSPSQRKNLQAIVGGEESPSSVSKGFDYLFGRPDVPGDPNILGSSAQAAAEASASDATPSVTPTIESPSEDAQGQAGAVQSPFLQSPDTPSGLGGPLLRGFNMVNDASRLPNAPMGQEATQAALGGRTLNEYLNAPAGTESVSGLRTDPQGRMIPSGFETRAEAFPDYEDQAAAREARLAARPDFGDAVSDRDRRAARGEGISVADRTAMAKANASGASPSEIARGNKIADELGVDLETGQPLQPAGGLTFEQQLALRKEQRAEREEVRSVAEQEREWEQTQGEARQKRVDEMNTEIGALTSIIGQAENISGVATEASRKVGAGTTGFFSPIKWIGGTTAADLAGNLETIKSDAFVANITEMRQNSPTGGAVGNVSDKDLEMLQSLQTSFRQNLKPTTLKKNLKKYKDIRDKVARDAKAGFIRKYGTENFNTYFGNQQQGGTQVSSIPNDRDSNTQVDPELQQYFN